MAITGTTISNTAGVLLQDTTAIRFPLPDRLTWINEGRREMARIKPEIFGNGTEISHTLSGGCKQQISNSSAFRLVSIDSHDGAAIRPTTKQQLDAFKPGWRSDTGTAVQNWFSDEIDPLSFWVYPASTGTLTLHAHLVPADLNSLADTALPFDIYANALVNYLCYRAYSKDATPKGDAGDAQKAQAFLALFMEGLK